MHPRFIAPAAVPLARARVFALLFALLVAGTCAHAQTIQPIACIEILPAQPNYLIRWGYINFGNQTTYVPPNSAANIFQPNRSPAGAPSTFAIGFQTTTLTQIQPQATVESWWLTQFHVSARLMPGMDSNGNTIPSTPLCPLVLRPATLAYTAPGTYANVYLAQVDSGPTATGVTLSALSGAAGVTFSNLVYTPADTASPVAGPNANPNSIYGTVTVAPNATSGSIYLQFMVGGATSAGASVPVSVGP